MKYKLVIFDFDGTLTDSFPWLVSILDQLADQYHFKRIDKSELETLRGYTVNRLVRDYRVPLWRIPRISSHIKALMARDFYRVPRFEGVDRLFHHLTEEGIQIAMVTSNSWENVLRVLGAENTRLIRYAECGVSLFGKPAKLRKVLRESGLRSHEVLCVGDEIRDIKASKKTRIPFGAVSWGYANVEALMAYTPEEVFSSIEDMIAKIIG